MSIFDSLPNLSAQQIGPINAFYRQRPALATMLGGRKLAITTAWPHHPDTASAAWCSVALRIDDADGELMVSRALLDTIMASVDPALSIEHLDADVAALVLESALEDSLAAIEAGIGCRIALTSVRVGRPEPDRPSLAFRLGFETGGASRCELCLGPDDITRLSAALDRCAGTAVAPFDVPVPICLRVAAATLTVRELRSLVPGAVVLIDTRHQLNGQAVAVAADHIIAPVELAPEGAIITARFLRGRGSPWEWSMDKPTEISNSQKMEESGLGDLPVRLVFELGRVELPLSALERLAPGAVLPLARSLEEPLDVVANGKRLGRGSLVRIGESLGVRIESLVGHD